MQSKEIDALSTIQKNYHTFSAVETKIADVILAAPQKAVHFTMQQLSVQAGVSSGSIINFCNRIGFSGFTNLKIELAQSLSKQNQKIFLKSDGNPGGKEKMHQIIAQTISSFQTTYDGISEREFEDAALMLAKVKGKIEIYGVGSSSMVAMDAYYRFMRIGLPAYAVTDALLCSVSASMLQKGSVAFGISHSGRTKETLRAMELAKEHGAKTICLTSFANSPLAKLCDSSLIISSIESEGYQEAMVSRLSQLMIVDSLCAYIGSMDCRKSLHLMENLAEIYEEHR